jgi:hypothetical protein
MDRRTRAEQKRGHMNFNTARIADLKKSRKGKHHDLMVKVIEDLGNSESGFAVEIPLATLDGVSVLNLRSAIIRAAAKEGVQVSTSSDDKNFYVWKAETRTRKSV